VSERPPPIAVPRPDEAAPADEMTMARAWLVHLRDSAVFKLADLDAVLDAAASFDLPSREASRPTTLRWIVTHLIEETARHLGHMDITRELLDGRTGR
jgi:hypothetical protein